MGFGIFEPNTVFIFINCLQKGFHGKLNAMVLFGRDIFQHIEDMPVVQEALAGVGET